MAVLRSFLLPPSSIFPNPNSKSLCYNSRAWNGAPSVRLYATMKDEKEPAANGSLTSLDLPERKSFAVSTGDFFLGLFSRILKSKSSRQLSTLDRKRLNGDSDRDGLASVIVDDVDPGVIWERRKKDVEAERERPRITSPGFSFSAAGLLFPYHIGVAQLLIEKGYIRENTPLAGSSAGAIVCAVIASGSSMEDALKFTKLLAEDCRLNGTAFRLESFQYVPGLNTFYGIILDESRRDTVAMLERIILDEPKRVAVTQVFRRPRALLVDQFDSKKDLIDAVVTSSFIPGYLAPRPATLYRNRICVDGGLTLFMPPTSASETVRVCAFPASRLGLEGIGISPDCNPMNRATPRQLFQWALEPAEDHLLDQFSELGYRDAAAWAEQNPIDTMLKEENLAE